MKCNIIINQIHFYKLQLNKYLRKAYLNINLPNLDLDEMFSRYENSTSFLKEILGC